MAGRLRAIFVCCVLLVTACEVPPQFASRVLPGPEVDGPSSFRFFSPSSFWNTPLADNARLDPASAAITADLLTQLDRGAEWINTDGFSTPIYTVSANQPRIPVELTRSFSHPGVLDAFSSVPMPSNARPSVGFDGYLVVHQPSTDQLWEFWIAQGPSAEAAEAGHGASRWGAMWGGRLDGASSSDGVFPQGVGPSASGLALVGGTILLSDMEAGRIDHALAMAIPDVRAGVYTSPANRTDGTSSRPTAVPMGARLRIDPDVDLAALGLPRPTLVIAEAAQQYGLILRDTSGGQITLYGEDPTPGDDQAVYERFFEGRSADQVMEAFPWQHLELLQMDLRSD